MKNAIKSEPVLFQGLVVAVVVAGLGALRAFGVPLTDEQANAAKLLAGAVLVLWLFLIRAQVTPAAFVAAKDTGIGVVAGPAAAVVTGQLVEVTAPQTADPAAYGLAQAQPGQEHDVIVEPARHGELEDPDEPDEDTVFDPASVEPEHAA